MLCQMIAEHGTAGVPTKALLDAARNLKPGAKDTVLRAALAALKAEGHVRDRRGEGGTVLVAEGDVFVDPTAATAPAPNPHHDEPF